jgi:hypothetical protein
VSAQLVASRAVLSSTELVNKVYMKRDMLLGHRMYVLKLGYCALEDVRVTFLKISPTEFDLKRESY